MKTANLIIAILYSFLLILLFFFSFSGSSMTKYPYQQIAILVFCGPVVVNWISYKNWDKPDSRVKAENLAAALAYTALFAILFIDANGPEFVGLVVLGAPTAINWLTVIARIKQARAAA